MTIREHFTEAEKILHEFINNPDNFTKIENAGKIMVDAIKSGGKIFSCGNGGSMSDAMHFAQELTGRYRNNRKALPAIAIYDPTHITCVANDFGADYIFSRYIEALATENDVLLAISTSGNSRNIIEAVNIAKHKNMKVIALTGKTGGLLKELVDIEIRTPMSEYSDRVQEIHIKIIHSLIDFIEGNVNFTS